MTAPADETDPDDIDEENDEEGEEGEEEPKKKKLTSKQLISLVGMGLIVLLLAGSTTAYFMGWIHSMLGIEQEKNTAVLELGKPVTFELPQFKVDLKSGTCKAPFLRAQFNIQLSSEDVGQIEASQDKMMEQIMLHLRSLERQDLTGKEGANRLRFDLVKIINTVVAPSRIHGIIYKEFVLQ